MRIEFLTIGQPIEHNLEGVLAIFVGDIVTDSRSVIQSTGRLIDLGCNAFFACGDAAEALHDLIDLAVEEAMALEIPTLYDNDVAIADAASLLISDFGGDHVSTLFVLFEPNLDRTIEIRAQLLFRFGII